MERRYALAIATATGRTVSHHRQVLRCLREQGFVPGNSGPPPGARQIARIVLALAGDNVGTAVEAVKALRGLPLRSPCELPSYIEDMLTRLVEVLPTSPVVADLDIDDGTLHLGQSSVSLDARTLSGKPITVTYGSTTDTVERKTSVPIKIIRALADSIRRTSH